MPNYSREVSNRVSNNRKTLEGSVSNFSGLKKLVLLGLASVLISGCRITPEGRNFINSMGYTAAGTFIQESVSKEVWGNGQETMQGGIQRSHSDRKLIFSRNKWVYHEDGTAYRTKLEDGKFSRMKMNGEWIPVQQGTQIFYFK